LTLCTQKYQQIDIIGNRLLPTPSESYVQVVYKEFYFLNNAADRQTKNQERLHVIASIMLQWFCSFATF